MVKLSPGSSKKNIYAYKGEAVDEMSERGKVVQKTYKIIPKCLLVLVKKECPVHFPFFCVCVFLLTVLNPSF